MEDRERMGPEPRCGFVLGAPAAFAENLEAGATRLCRTRRAEPRSLTPPLSSNTYAGLWQNTPLDTL